MYRPPYFISHRVRLTIMISLIVSFFIISPLLILYTTGYRYDWQKHVFLTTGVLSVEGDPREMDIFVNDALIKKAVPVRLTNLTPGTYRVRLERDGYITWEKDVTVESNKTTYIKHISLLRKNDPALLSSVRSFTSLALSNDGAYILATRQSASGTYHLSLFNTETEKETPFSMITASSPPHVEWSPFGPNAVVSWRDNQGSYIRLISGEREQETQTYTLFHISKIPMQWDSSGASRVFFQDGDGVFSLKADGVDRLASLPTTSTPWYKDRDDDLWIYDKQAMAVTRTTKNGGVQESITVTQPLDSFIHINEARLITRHEHTIDVIERTTPFEIHSLPTESVTFNPGTHEWITWSPWELWTIYEDGNMTLLNRTGDPIRHVRPLDDFGVLLVATENALTAFNPGYYVTQKILDEKDIREMRVNQNERKIIFVKSAEKKEELFELFY